jgi:hypothetical protein
MPWRRRGGVELHFYSVFNLGARWVCVVDATVPAALRPGEKCCQFTEDWVGPRAGLDGRGKSHPTPLGFERLTFQLVASRYTDYTIPAYHAN